MLPIQINFFLKEYPNKTILFKHLVIENKITILLGENGSGKSTLLKGIMGLISYEGTIKDRNTKSYMPEQPYFPKDVTVNEFITTLCDIEETDKKYNEYLQKMHLTHKKHSVITSLSKGMKAKVNLLQCLLKPSDVYLLDEPLSGLDENSIKILIELMHQLEGSFIISTHILRPFLSHSSEVIHLDELT